MMKPHYRVRRERSFLSMVGAVILGMIGFNLLLVFIAIVVLVVIVLLA